ncbi:hypothetical protein D3C80_1029540 [compost metagenome]
MVKCIDSHHYPHMWICCKPHVQVVPGFALEPLFNGILEVDDNTIRASRDRFLKTFRAAARDKQCTFN